MLSSTTTTCSAACAPIVTPAPGKKPVPRIVTAVPPATFPDGGSTAVTVGEGTCCS
jgi:hypothetical protein